MSVQRLCIGLLLLGVFVSVRADEELKNADFSDGLANWEGTGEPAATASESANPLPLTDPQSKLGVLIKLDAKEWTKIHQRFHTLGSKAILKIVYRCSSNLAFSTDYEDYRNAPELLGYDPSPSFSGEPGMWMVFLWTSHGLRHYLVGPKPGTDVQTFEVEVKQGGLNNGLCLCFPPGNGTVVLLHVELESGPDGASDPGDAQQ